MPAASGSLAALALEVEQIHAAADDAVEQYASQSGLRCPSACGACCHSPEIEVTVLDALPLAWSILRDGLQDGGTTDPQHSFGNAPQSAAELMLEAVSQQDAPGCPVFIDQGAGPSGEKRGRCSRYAKRPSFCRLYGFSGWTNKQGIATLAMCRTQKDLGAQVDPSIKPPLFTEFTHRLQALHPDLGSRRLPIHLAIKEALEKVLLADRFARDSEPTPTEWGTPPVTMEAPHKVPGEDGGELPV